jgi:hypothetical protein
VLNLSLQRVSGITLVFVLPSIDTKKRLAPFRTDGSPGTWPRNNVAFIYERTDLEYF